MAETWPAALEDKLNVAGFQYQIGPTAIRSENDVGLAKVRRRFTKGVDTLSVSINLTYTEFNDLYNFWDVTLNGGVNRFEFDHPFTGALTEFRMVSPPRIGPRARGGREFLVTMEWEIPPV